MIDDNYMMDGFFLDSGTTHIIGHWEFFLLNTNVQIFATFGDSLAVEVLTPSSLSPRF